MSLLRLLRRAGPLTGPARFSFRGLALSLPLLFLTLGAGQKAPQSRATDSILGIRIGMSLEEVRAKLGPLGTAGGRATREGGRKEAWTLKRTDYSSIAFKTNPKGLVVWVTGFLRPGKEVPFSDLGDISRAFRATDSQAIWNVKTPDGGYRLVAKGQNGKARVTYLLSLAVPPP